MRAGLRKLAAGAAVVFSGAPLLAAGREGSALIAQAQAAAPTTRSGSDFVIPVAVVILFFGIAIFAVSRSSHRV